MEDYDLGRFAYESYSKATDWRNPVNGSDIPSFDNLPGPVRNGWCNVGKEMRMLFERRFALGW